MAGEILNLATCFQYRNPANQDLITKSPIEDYVTAIGNKLCALATQTNSQNNVIGILAVRVQALESAPAYSYTLPKLFPTGIANSNVALPLDQFTQLLESQFSQERNSVGSPTKIFNVLATQPPSFGQNKALGSTGGTLSSLPNFSSDIQDLSDFIKNLFVILQDARSAISNIKLAMPTSCDSVSIIIQATYQARNLKLFFTGTIPDNLVNCIASGSSFKIEDTSGNYVNINVDVKGNINTGAPFNIDLTGTSINPADDLKVSSTVCLNDVTLGSVCQKYIEIPVNNTSSCPSVSYSPSYTSISFSFLHSEGSLTYVIQLFDIVGNLIQSRTVAVSSPTSVSGTFDGLQVYTQYKARVQMVTGIDNIRSCVLTPLRTLSNPCPAPNAVTVVIDLS